MSFRVTVLLLAASANARSLPQPTLTASAGGAARKDEHPLIRPVSGGLASCTAEICTLPIDRTKVMMQIATDSKGLVGTMRNDLCLTKRLWDITSVVQTTLEEWRSADSRARARRVSEQRELRAAQRGL